RAFGEANWDIFWMAATLTAFVFNDVLYSSHFIEKEPARYSLSMKICDVVGFLFLATAILALHPAKDNIFEAPPGDWFRDLRRVSLFWCVLSIYWINLIVWNVFAGFFSGQHVKIWYYFIGLVILLLMVALSFFHRSDFQRIAEGVAFIISLVFLFIIKPI